MSRLRWLFRAAPAFPILVIAVAAAHAQPGPGDDSVPLAGVMLTRLNEARNDSGLPAVRVNSILERIAFAHAREIAANNHYSHTGLDGRKPKDRARDAGYGAGREGVRIGENFVGRQHLDDGFQWLMEDPPHRANMLHPDYREVGVGAARMSYGYVWVIDFGTYAGIDTAPAKPTTAPPAPTDTPFPPTATDTPVPAATPTGLSSATPADATAPGAVTPAPGATDAGGYPVVPSAAPGATTAAGGAGSGGDAGSNEPPTPGSPGGIGTWWWLALIVVLLLIGLAWAMQRRRTSV